MSFRLVAGLTCAAAVLLAPAAHASSGPICVLPFGSAVPAGLRSWKCTGPGPIQGPCRQVAVVNPNTGLPLAGVEICGV